MGGEASTRLCFLPMVGDLEVLLDVSVDTMEENSLPSNCREEDASDGEVGREYHM